MTDYYTAFWNLENLFDVQNSPRRSEKLQRTLKKELKGWNAGILNGKIRQLASIIVQMNDGRGPDLLGACEIENDHVLNLLKDALAPLNRNYDVAHADTEDRRGIDVGFIYDAERLTAEEKFSHYIIKRTATRDLFQVNFRTNAGRLLVVIGNHWPARLGGQQESEPYRIIAGETLAYFHDRILQIQGKNTAILGMGDFNDEPFDHSLVNHALSERGRNNVTRARSPKFLNLMWQILGEKQATHYYDNHPNVLDQFLASKGLVTGKSGIRVLVDTVKVAQFNEMVGTGTYPVPLRFGRGSSVNRNGFSDHFPIAVTLQET